MTDPAQPAVPPEALAAGLDAWWRSRSGRGKAPGPHFAVDAATTVGYHAGYLAGAASRTPLADDEEAVQAAAAAMTCYAAGRYTHPADNRCQRTCIPSARAALAAVDGLRTQPPPTPTEETP